MKGIFKATAADVYIAAGVGKKKAKCSPADVNRTPGFGKKSAVAKRSATDVHVAVLYLESVTHDSSLYVERRIDYSEIRAKRSSSVIPHAKIFTFCRVVGWSNELSHGWGDVAGSAKTAKNTPKAAKQWLRLP